MHEMGIMQEIMRIIDQEIERNHVKKILEVILKIAEMAAIIPDSLRFCFEIISSADLAVQPRSPTGRYQKKIWDPFSNTHPLYQPIDWSNPKTGICPIGIGLINYQPQRTTLKKRNY